MSEISDKSITSQISQADLDFFSSNGYVLRTSKVEYDQASAEVVSLEQINQRLLEERKEGAEAERATKEDEKKAQGLLFDLHGKEYKDAALQKLEADKETLSKNEVTISSDEASVSDYIQKKSTLDWLVPYGNEYLSLSASGVIMLNALNARMSRISDMEFSDFVLETNETDAELRGIAQRARSFVFDIRNRIPLPTDMDEDAANRTGEVKVSPYDSVLWSVGIGLAKIRANEDQILDRFVSAYNSLGDFKSSVWNKLMAGEVMAATVVDFMSLSQSLTDIEQKLRNFANVPEEQSVAIAATLIYGGSDSAISYGRFVEFSKITESQETAAILAITNINVEQLTSKFHSYKGLFDEWGYSTSDDTDLAAAYLSISPLVADDVRSKMNTIVDALKSDLQYPLVAAAILTSMSALSATEAIDLVEKGISILQGYASNFGRSELVSLAVRMVHGVNNELAKELDPNASISKTPVQFTHSPQQVAQSAYGTGQYYGGYYPGFWWYYALIISHSTYHNTYNTGGGYHEGHQHGLGGFA